MMNGKKQRFHSIPFEMLNSFPKLEVIRQMAETVCFAYHAFVHHIDDSMSLCQQKCCDKNDSGSVAFAIRNKVVAMQKQKTTTTKTIE